jgi:hypothetical protein
MTSVHRDLFVSYHKLQQTVGWIALLMPITVRLLAYVSEGVFTTNSISAYYYTSLRDVFRRLARRRRAVARVLQNR